MNFQVDIKFFITKKAAFQEDSYAHSFHMEKCFSKAGS